MIICTRLVFATKKQQDCIITYSVFAFCLLKDRKGVIHCQHCISMLDSEDSKPIIKEPKEDLVYNLELGISKFLVWKNFKSTFLSHLLQN